MVWSKIAILTHSCLALAPVSVINVAPIHPKFSFVPISTSGKGGLFHVRLPLHVDLSLCPFVYLCLITIYNKTPWDCDSSFFTELLYKTQAWAIRWSVQHISQRNQTQSLSNQIHHRGHLIFSNIFYLTVTVLYLSLMRTKLSWNTCF